MGISVEDFHLNLFVFLSVYSWMLSFEHVFISIAQLKPKKTFTSIGHHPSDFCDQILLHESQILEKKIYVRELPYNWGTNKYSKIWGNNHTSVLRNGGTKSTIPIQTTMAITLANGHLLLFIK
jgi:hypothetical protein